MIIYHCNSGAGEQIQGYANDLGFDMHDIIAMQPCESRLCEFSLRESRLCEFSLREKYLELEEVVECRSTKYPIFNKIVDTAIRCLWPFASAALSYGHVRR